MRDCILGLDFGTSSCKGILVDSEGRCEIRSSRYTRGDDPNTFLRAVEHVLMEFREAFPERHPVAMGLSGQTSSYILEFQSGELVMYPWNVTGGQEYVDRANCLLPPKLQRQTISMGQMRQAAYPIPKFLWLRDLMGERWKEIRRIFQPKDYVYYCLTGVYVSDPYSWRGLANQEDMSFHREVLDLLGLEEGQLPPLMDSFAEAGVLRPGGISSTILPAELPAYVGYNDFYAGLTGMGIHRVGDSFDVTGTSEHIGTISDSDPDHPQLMCTPYLTGCALYGVTNNCGRTFGWLGDHMPDFDSHEARYSRYIRADSPIYLPYMDGERAPVWLPNASGVLLGLSARHTQEDIAAAMIEGVAFAASHIWRCLDRPAGSGVIHVSGGLAYNRFLNTVKATLTDCPLMITHQSEASVLGAAIAGAVGIGWFDGLQTAANMWIQPGQYAEPDGTVRGLLEDRFQRYLTASQTLCGMWGGQD